MKVYFLMTDGFEETEAVTPWDILIRAGAEVYLVSVSGSLSLAGAHGLNIKADMLIDEIKDGESFDMLVLPGGGKGAETLASSEKVKALLTRAVNENTFIGAICASPMALGRHGVLTGVKATCFPGFETKLGGAVFTDQKTVLDGKFITAKGMGVSMEFGFLLVKALYGEKKEEELKKSTQFS